MDIAYIIIFADINDEKMKSRRFTALHEVCGRPLICWTLSALRSFCNVKPIVVCRSARDADEMHGCTGDSAECVLREELRSRLKQTKTGCALILPGTMPLLSAETLEMLCETARQDRATRLVYEDEAGEAVKSSVICLPCVLLECENIPACINKMEAAGQIASVSAGELECMRVQDRAGLWNCTYILQRRIINEHLKNGVTFRDPNATYVDADVTIGADTVLMPGVMLSGNTSVGENCVISGACRLNDTIVGNDCVLQDVVANQVIIGDGVKAGPFVNLRLDTVLKSGVKVGDFVEIKNSLVDEGSKLPHLSYIGDSDIGKRVNVGCGCVFVNYDGFEKHRTVVGDDVFLGCQTNLVAPITVGNDAFTAAGSTLTEDVPDGAFAIARSHQTNKQGWVEKYRALKAKKK